MERRPSLAFVGNIFHTKTHSADFLKELLAPHFDITEYWDKTSVKGPPVSIESINKHDVVVFFQRINPLPDLEKVTATMVWVPMLDSVSFDYFFWKTLSLMPIKVVCFSKVLFEQCKRFGIETIYAQYYVAPERTRLQSGNRKVFFWNRGPITFGEVTRVLDPQSIDGITILSRPDPRFEKETYSVDDAERYSLHIVESPFREGREEYSNVSRECGIFIAPRKKEGIGLSFVEAMAAGQVVIGWNEGTINEYIQHGHNGYLFGSNTISPLNLSNLEQVRQNSVLSAQKGFDAWQKEKGKIVVFMESEATRPKPSELKRQLYHSLYKLKLWQFKIRTKYLKRWKG